MSEQMSARDKAGAILSGAKLRMLEEAGLTVVEQESPCDFVTKAYDMVKTGTVEYMHAAYRGDQMVVIVRKATKDEIR